MEEGSDAPVTGDRTSAVKEKALLLGFDTVGVTDLSPPPHGDALTSWLKEGMAGTMTYMNRQAKKRANPSLIVPGASRAVVVTKNYFDEAPRSDPGRGVVARYARGRDYHTTLAPRLSELADCIRETGGQGATARAYVDAGPVPERELAQRAGLGWIGKNTMLIDRNLGSFFFIGSVLTNVELEPDSPFEQDHCGSCSACIEACPTDAIVAERVVDSRLCISYLTIEARGEPNRELAAKMSNLVFGCDICQDVCPWNISFAKEVQDDVLDRRREMSSVDLRCFEDMDEAEFERRFGWTPLERSGLEGMRRNAGIALRNEIGEG